MESPYKESWPDVCECVCFKVLFKEKNLWVDISARTTNNAELSKTHISIAYFKSANLSSLTEKKYIS